jgi:hypothetical protein
MGRGLGWFLSATWQFIVIITPIIIWSMGVALASFIYGVPKTTEWMADDWSDALRSAYELPNGGKDFYYRGAQAVAIFFVILGWICASFLTVFLVMWLMR